MDRWTDGRLGGWADGWMDGWADGWMDGWADGRTGGRTDGRADGRTGGRVGGRTVLVPRDDVSAVVRCWRGRSGPSSAAGVTSSRRTFIRAPCTRSSKPSAAAYPPFPSGRAFSRLVGRSRRSQGQSEGRGRRNPRKTFFIVFNFFFSTIWL